MKYIKKFKLLLLALKGEIIKLCIDCSLVRIPSLIKDSLDCSPSLIISLTSYGRRVRHTVFYTLVSLLRQSNKHIRIILWLDKDEWSMESIPLKLRRLIDKGIEIKFCSNIRSYKKLIPTLQLYPECNIITVDDDIYYHKTLISEFLSMNNRFPNTIISNACHKIKFFDGRLAPYNDWELDTTTLNEEIFPTGAGGVFYPINALYEDVLKDDLFMKLAPKADDVWFFFMGYLKRTRSIKSDKKVDMIPVDLFYQKFHKGSSLRDSNCGESQNDIQIRTVMKFYNISAADLESFCKYK